MRLSLELGRPLGELKRTLPEAEFRVYSAYFTHEPSVGERLDWWNGQLLAAAVNPYRPKGKPPVRPAGVTPRRWAPAYAGTRSLVEKVLAWGRGMAAIGKGG